MGFNDDLKRKKDGSYILKHKSKEGKVGDCTEDMILVRKHIDGHLRSFSKHESIKPIWCKECQVLRKYLIKIKYEEDY